MSEDPDGAEGAAPARRTSTMRLALLGGFGLTRGELRLSVPRSCQRLVGLLALGPELSDRTQVTARLWPDADDDRARGCLRSALWRLRRSEGRDLLPAGELRLDPAVELDLRDAFAVAERLMARPDPLPGPDEVRLLHLDVLPAWDDDWVRPERERYRQARLHALEALSHHLLRASRYGEAISAALTAVTADPLRESAQCTLIAAYLAEGNQHEALVQYRDCHRAFVEALGTPPSRRLDALIEPALALR